MDAVLRVDERREGDALCAKLLNATVARRMITKAECMVEAGGPHLGGGLGIPAKYFYMGAEGSEKRARRGLGLLP